MGKLENQGKFTLKLPLKMENTSCRIPSCPTLESLELTWMEALGEQVSQLAMDSKHAPRFQDNCLRLLAHTIAVWIWCVSFFMIKSAFVAMWGVAWLSQRRTRCSTLRTFRNPNIQVISLVTFAMTRYFASVEDPDTTVCCPWFPGTKTTNGPSRVRATAPISISKC